MSEKTVLVISNSGKDAHQWALAAGLDRDQWRHVAIIQDVVGFLKFDCFLAVKLSHNVNFHLVRYVNWMCQSGFGKWVDNGIQNPTVEQLEEPEEEQIIESRKGDYVIEHYKNRENQSVKSPNESAIKKLCKEIRKSRPVALNWEATELHPPPVTLVRPGWEIEGQGCFRKSNRAAFSP